MAFLVGAQVGQSQVLALPGDAYQHSARERLLQVQVSAEGPTCVLTVADLQASAPPWLVTCALLMACWTTAPARCT